MSLVWNMLPNGATVRSLFPLLSATAVREVAMIIMLPTAEHVSVTVTVATVGHEP